MAIKGRVIVAALVALFGLPMAVQAQGVVGGAEQGAARGHRAAGPVGAVVGGAVGGAVGGVVGGVRGVLGLHHRYRAYPYHRPVYHPVPHRGHRHHPR